MIKGRRMEWMMKIRRRSEIERNRILEIEKVEIIF